MKMPTHCVKWCLHIVGYKHGEDINICILSDKFKVDRICTSGNYA
jgi:hypothetical protein